MTHQGEAPYNTARRIVCEEWQAAVKEFGLTPGSVTERVVSRIINRLDETVWPAGAEQRLAECTYPDCECVMRNGVRECEPRS